MPILTDVPVSVAAEEIIESRGQRQIRPELLQDAEEAIALGQTLWEPRAVYEWYDVDAVDGQSVTVSYPDQAGQGATLRIGSKANLMKGAQRVLVTVATIGPALEQRVHELHNERQSLKAYMLDNAGVVALGAVGEAIRCLAEETAAGHGLGRESFPEPRVAGGLVAAGPAGTVRPAAPGVHWRATQLPLRSGTPQVSLGHHRAGTRV